MRIGTGGVVPERAIAMLKWIIANPGVVTVYNRDGHRLVDHNFVGMLHMLENNGDFQQRFPNWRFPLDGTIESDDPELLVWFKLKFL